MGHHTFDHPLSLCCHANYFGTKLRHQVESLKLAARVELCGSRELVEIVSPLHVSVMQLCCCPSYDMQAGFVMQLQKKKGSAKGKSKPPTRSTKVPTFFDFFSPPVVPESDTQLTEDQMEDLQNALEKDYELGWVTHSRIVTVIRILKHSLTPTPTPTAV